MAGCATETAMAGLEAPELPLKVPEFVFGVRPVAKVEEVAKVVEAPKVVMEVPKKVEDDAGPRFLGHRDEEILAGLCGKAIQKLSVNWLGTTVKFKATLEGGQHASLRPAQISTQGYFRADVAAYRLSRALGLGTVAPACVTTVKREQLVGAGGAKQIAQRIEQELQWDHGGQTIQASLLYWIEDVRSVNLEQDMAQWKPLLMQVVPLKFANPSLVKRAAEGSRLLAWDFLIANWDRWSGQNTFRSGEKGPYVWLDNAAGFGRWTLPIARASFAQVRQVERFSRSFIEALRKPTDEELEKALLPSGLPAKAIDQVTERRKSLLIHVDKLIARYGKDRVLCFE